MFLALLTTLICLICGYWYISTKRPKNYPPGPAWFPIVGNTPLLRREASILGGQPAVFENWMKKYKSPVIGLKLGRENVVVALTYPMVHEIHVNDAYDGRPDNFFLRLRTMGSRLGITCTDGDFWAEQRNFVTKHLRRAGYGRQPMEIQIQNELNELLDVIAEYKDQPVWPGKFLPPSVINVLWTFTAGEKISRNDERLTRLLTLMQQRSKAFDMSGGILNSMPFLRFIAPEKTSFNLINRFNKELHDFFMATINEHKVEYTEEKSADDLIFAYIKEMQSREGTPSNFTDLQLNMIILDMFIAGSQTTSITLDLALMMMALHPEIQTQVQKDIDRVLGDAQLPTLSDKSQLSYVEAVLLEVQRFFSITPITGPRRVLKATQLGGYDIPKNTTILMGIKTVHMDKEFWGDPEDFRPNRFLDDANKLTNMERFMSFGLGKRRCLGEALARACLFTFFVGILQKYKIKVPENSRCPPALNGLVPGIVLSPKPYEVLLSRRSK